jgi:urea transport system permease protein
MTAHLPSWPSSGLPRILLLPLLFAAFLLAALPARAAALDGAIAKFAADNFSDTEAGIAVVAVSGVPNAADILEALGAGNLEISGDGKTLVYKDKSGRLIDATTAAPIATPPTGMRTVRVNNRLRRAIEAALGTLTLLAPDPTRRMQAAESIFKSKDAASLQALETAIAAEKDARIKRAFQEARAAVLVMKADTSASERAAAVLLLRDRGDQDAIAALRQAMPQLSPDLKSVASDAITAIEGRLALLAQVQNVWYGLSLGSVLLLAAIGLAITFGVMGVINMAHGEMVMLGAYTTFVVQEIIRTSAPHLFDWSLPIAIPLAFLVTALVGIAIERGIIRFLYGRPLETLLATWGVSLILQQAVRTAFGPTNREVGAPSYMSGAFEVFGLSITYGRLWIVVFTLVVFFTLLAVLRYTPLGLQMRAVTQNRRMASAMGIRTPWIDAMTFALGSGVAGIAGVALSQIDNVSPNLGQTYIIDSFMVVVFGGVGSLWGTLVSAFALGVANKFLEPLAGAVLAKIFILVLLILFIQKRPRGLFALKGRAIET